MTVRAAPVRPHETLVAEREAARLACAATDVTHHPSPPATGRRLNQYTADSKARANERLRAIAVLYAENGSATEVARAFGMSVTRFYQLLKKARARGLLEAEPAEDTSIELRALMQAIRDPSVMSFNLLQTKLGRVGPYRPIYRALESLGLAEAVPRLFAWRRAHRRHARAITRQAVLLAKVRRFIARTGRLPTSSDLLPLRAQRDPDLPHVTDLSAAFGGMPNFWRALGYQAPRRAPDDEGRTIWTPPTPLDESPSRLAEVAHAH